MKRHNPLEVWIRDSGHYAGAAPYEVRYGKYILARFVRKELAVAYRDWFWSRLNSYLKDPRLGCFTLHELIGLSATYRRGGNNV